MAQDKPVDAKKLSQHSKTKIQKPKEPATDAKGSRSTACARCKHRKQKVGFFFFLSIVLVLLID